MAASDPTDIPAAVPNEPVDALYGLPLDDFTASRDALARQLRQTGQRQQAEWVKGLRKPSAAAWVVNQLARTQPQEAKRLLEAGERLRAAHERVLAGEAGAEELRRAAERQIEAVGALLARAPGLLDRDGHAPSPATVEKAGQTLQAVALDEQARAAFAVGRLTRERRATGLGLTGSDVSAPTSPKRARPKKRPGIGDRNQRHAEQAAKARKALDDAQRRQRTRRRAVESAERELEQARNEAERIERELEQARHEADRARRRLEQARSELEEAQAAEAQAQARVAEAEAAVEDAS